ncbi:hypothetical protein O6H91_05G099700 [Diphasiastrum complanatum]|uniref:Uncharacterized protein n=1 Tax=Diphasiastrum complanatum TaxID=34168 RepID=A0ACC2DRA9_DIPCM|nr:hypothetical protein O6H91_05G099700 [Diphasiastrum complanatum]
MGWQWHYGWLARWTRARLVDPFLLILSRGAEPKHLAMSAALGITLGVFPIYGITALLCGFAVALLRSKCHAPTLMLANLLATPLELSLILPFLQFGEWMTGSEHLLLSTDVLGKALTLQAPHEVLLGISHAFLGWAVASPFILGSLYGVFILLFRFLPQKSGGEPVHQYFLAHQQQKNGELFTSCKDPVA